MKSFSQRIGIKPIKVEIQRKSADELLRNDLWNLIFTKYHFNTSGGYKTNSDYSLVGLLEAIWTKYFRRRIDELGNPIGPFIQEIKNTFLDCEWHEMFDLLEFLPNNFPARQDEIFINDDFVTKCNLILKQNLSAYRFVNKIIVEIDSEEEIKSIENALSVTDKFASVQTHIKSALILFSDKKNPDYRNSIKESISGVEAICRIITNDPKSTLGIALKSVEAKHNIHPALKDAFSKLYGYTNDGDGIRHALFEESNLGQEDAKFMLVACSAFINYLIVKTEL